MALGGAAAVGYTAHQLMADAQLKFAPAFDAPTTLDEFAPVNGHTADQQAQPVNVAATAAATRAYNETLLVISPWLQLKSLALNTLIGIAKESAALAVPLVAGYLTANLDRARNYSADVASRGPRRSESPGTTSDNVSH